MKKITEIKVTRYRTEAKRDKLGNRIKSQIPYKANRPVEVMHGGKRFAHYFVDLVAFQLLYTLISIAFTSFTHFIPFSFTFMLGAQFSIGFLFIISYPLYYFLMEYFFQQTLGKMLTKAYVIDEFGNRPNAGTLILRSIIRWVPFNRFSCLFNERGWHDRWSNTYVVSKDELGKIRNLLTQNDPEDIGETLHEILV